jgi:hypothetical protein
MASRRDNSGRKDREGSSEGQRWPNGVALKRQGELLGEKHPDTLLTLSNLAGVLDDQGEYEHAEEMHRQVLGLRETVLGKEHPGTSGSINNSAKVLSRQGKYEQAEEIHR